MKNLVILIGRVGKEPGVYSTVTSLTLATSDKWKDESGEWQERTEWHQVVCFKHNAEKAAKFMKGDLLAIEGKLQTRSYEQDGVKKWKTEIIAHKVQRILKHESNNNSGGASNTNSIEPKYDAPNENDDLPF